MSNFFNTVACKLCADTSCTYIEKYVTYEIITVVFEFFLEKHDKTEINFTD